MQWTVTEYCFFLKKIKDMQIVFISLGCWVDYSFNMLGRLPLLAAIETAKKNETIIFPFNSEYGVESKGWSRMLA